MEKLERFLHDMNIVFTAEDIEKINIYMKLFFEWNKVHHLSSLKTHDDFLRYCKDSLFPISFMGWHSCVMDVGSGAGFPALVIAIFLKEAKIYLIEPNKKKAAFLEIASLEMGLKNIVILKKRIQELGYFEVDLITSRALCSLKEFLSLIAPVSYKSILLYKGQHVDNELSVAKEEAKGFQVHLFGTMKYLYKEN